MLAQKGELVGKNGENWSWFLVLLRFFTMHIEYKWWNLPFEKKHRERTWSRHKYISLTMERKCPRSGQCQLQFNGKIKLNYGKKKNISPFNYLIFDTIWFGLVWLKISKSLQRISKHYGALKWEKYRHFLCSWTKLSFQAFRVSEKYWKRNCIKTRCLLCRQTGTDEEILGWKKK